MQGTVESGRRISDQHSSNKRGQGHTPLFTQRTETRQFLMFLPSAERNCSHQSFKADGSSFYNEQVHLVSNYGLREKTKR